MNSDQEDIDAAKVQRQITGKIPTAYYKHDYFKQFISDQ